MRRRVPHTVFWRWLVVEQTELYVVDPGICHAGVDEVGRGPLAGPVVAAA
ncbi:MAG TPA: hypothetical protein ENI83_01535, partial [Gammaproteobacteria bacterium]|nr:hypothetical protein [Gammaproteobacteria bacterium]